MTWEDFANSLNHAFSNEGIFTPQNVLIFIFIFLLAVILIAIIRYDAIKTDIQKRIAYQEARRQMLKEQESQKDSNQRSWYRMATDLPFKWHPICIATGIRSPDSFAGIIKDISGGGLLFFTDEIFNLNDQIRILLPLGKSILEVDAQIVRLQAVEAEDTEKISYLVGVEYVNILASDRDKIISWIMKSQAEDLLNQKIELFSELGKGQGFPTEATTSRNKATSMQKIWGVLNSEENIVFSGVCQNKGIELLVNLPDNEVINLEGLITNIKEEGSDTVTIKVFIKS